MALGIIQATLLTVPAKEDISMREMNEIADALERTSSDWLMGTERLGLLPAATELNDRNDPKGEAWRVSRLQGVNGALTEAASVLRTISQAMTPHFTPLSFVRGAQIEIIMKDLASTITDVLAPVNHAAALFLSQDLDDRGLEEMQFTASRIISACR